jgi:hypothetical protein
MIIWRRTGAGMRSTEGETSTEDTMRATGDRKDPRIMADHPHPLACAIEMRATTSDPLTTIIAHNDLERNIRRELPRERGTPRDLPRERGTRRDLPLAMEVTDADNDSRSTMRANEEAETSTTKNRVEYHSKKNTAIISEDTTTITSTTTATTNSLRSKFTILILRKIESWWKLLLDILCLFVEAQKHGALFNVVALSRLCALAACGSLFVSKMRIWSCVPDAVLFPPSPKVWVVEAWDWV